MTASWRLVVTVVLGTMLAIDTAALVCVPLDLSGTWLSVLIGVAGPFWAFVVDRGISKAEDAWKALQEASRTSRDGGDSTTLLALFAMREDPVRLFDVVLVLSPAPDAPSWLHPMRRWNVMTAWVRRNSELATEVRSLAESGLLRRTERGRWWEDMSFYEATGLGRDVAVRNAEVLMAGRIEEEA